MQKIPLTAIIFLLELTRGKAEFLMPLTLAMAGAMLTDSCISRCGNNSEEAVRTGIVLRDDQRWENILECYYIDEKSG